jgi:LacI family transcriptional regulator
VPSLSTVDQFISELGASAAQIVIDRVAGDNGPAKRICIPTRLRLRGSTGPLLSEKRVATPQIIRSRKKSVVRPAAAR